jgi:hypothetical protein
VGVLGVSALECGVPGNGISRKHVLLKVSSKHFILLELVAILTKTFERKGREGMRQVLIVTN